MRGAVAIAAQMQAPRGAPRPIKPPYELLAEILLDQGNVAEARAEFTQSLARRPNRTLSLRGAGRAAERAGDTAAARRYYDALLANLSGDPTNPSFREAKAFLDAQQASPVAQRRPL